MQAVYFGNSTFWGTGSGPGPWIMADLEEGLFSGLSPANNPADPSITSRFVTAAIKGRPNFWAIRGADAQRPGPLATYYSGIRPTVKGYNPMSLEGSIVLGIGGDNSKSAQGTFYEGVMTAGYPSDETENAVQADIAAARYAVASPNQGAALAVQSRVSFRITSHGSADARYMVHGADVHDAAISIEPASSLSAQNRNKYSRWTVRAGLGNAGCYSFESVQRPGSFLRHKYYVLTLDPNDGSKQFAEDATFCTLEALSGTGHSIRSWNYPTRLLRHFNHGVFAATNGGVQDFEGAASFNHDVSWKIQAESA
ncbi:hypothetical protein E4U21_001561 [Claviceps maximensis]|nr:hypothetical protein E4U21_001561 [Claviceps maximensis]